MGSDFWQTARPNFLEINGRQEGTIMLIGYARTSTLEQKAGLEAQVEALRAIGCEKVYQEQTSSVAARAQLRAAVDFSREGDTLVITKLDRLARSVRHLGEIVDELEGKRVGLRVLDLGLDTSNATGKLMLNVLGAVAQFEREIMLERQREGIARAKADGRYKGRKPTARMKMDEVRELLSAGVAKREVAKRLGISERSVYRLRAAK
jgi:DNA invertase Pin-like site-specific DNA recombinase